ncbi:uncharacterized protein KY384_006933 [Bacidia gigantensis]|uniref:uncharacterized protein n=1 Tax=Bacidia gigantensis TaxID=2732470 RepID=UPI001D048740|nr:uncharacterized protein KY384_006933 [Bacidia gigantensis]KAG8528017.1 hypothetical protein KY384_006933 [Bacidia gigantensis]
MAKFAKNAPTDTSKNPVIEKLMSEARRAEEAGRRKFVIQKKQREMNRKAAAKEKLKKEHALARAFSGTVQNSRACIEAKILSDVGEAKRDISAHLAQAVNDLSLTSQKLEHHGHDYFRPLQADGVEWYKADGSQSGVTDLGTIMKSLDRELSTKRKEISSQQVEWIKARAAVEAATKALFESETFEQILEGVHDTRQTIVSNVQILQREIEAAKKKTLEELEKETDETIVAMEEAERVGSLTYSDPVPSSIDAFGARETKLDKMQATYFALLTEEEY